jgi:hypothetical protein
MVVLVVATMVDYTAGVPMARNAGSSLGDYGCQPPRTATTISSAFRATNEMTANAPIR